MVNYIKHIINVYKNISNDIIKTPLEFNKRLSEKYNHNIFLKREDLQITRSFKLRGSLNKIKLIKQKNNYLDKIICASAGNHAQGVAYSCNKLGINGEIYVPIKTPLQKINRIEYYGNGNININLYGNNFSESLEKAQKEASKLDIPLIHPYDDYDIIDGQSTIGYEIYNKINPDLIICPIGGGGLISGISKYSKLMNPECKIIGVEPENAESMSYAIKNNKPKKLNNIDTFVDGASVSQVGEKTFNISKNTIDHLYSISNNKLSHEMINFYQDDGIILEPAGCLAPSNLDNIIIDLEKINLKINNKNKNKLNIVCILSGGNNDLTRYNEIMDNNLNYLELTHYFLIEFSQRPGELKLFINNILGGKDDIIRFEYIKKSNINYGKVLLGIELTNKNDIYKIIDNLNKFNFTFEKIKNNVLL